MKSKKNTVIQLVLTACSLLGCCFVSESAMAESVSIRLKPGLYRTTDTGQVNGRDFWEVNVVSSKNGVTIVVNQFIFRCQDNSWGVAACDSMQPGARSVTVLDSEHFFAEGFVTFGTAQFARVK